MPGPDPRGLSIEEHQDGTVSIIAEVWYYGNRAARLKRAGDVLQKITRTDWRCRWCCDRVTLHRHVDAVYCREACRKAAARARRTARHDRA